MHTDSKMSLYDGISVETAPIPEITDKVPKKEDGTSGGSEDSKLLTLESVPSGSETI